MNLINVKNQKDWSQTKSEVETVHCSQRNVRHLSVF